MRASPKSLKRRKQQNEAEGSKKRPKTAAERMAECRARRRVSFDEDVNVTYISLEMCLIDLELSQVASDTHCDYVFNF